MSNNEETYLESFMENLTNLPHDLRRNLELLRDLDAQCSADLQRLRLLQSEYILQAEEKVLNLEVVEMQAEDQAADDDKKPVYGVRALNADGTTSPSNPLVIPTTDELMTYTYHDSYQEIKRLQSACLQKSDEKVAVAKQAYEMIDAHVQRLDHDMAAMEQLLQSTGEFQMGVTAKPDDLAACQVTPGSEWILAKVIQHDPVTGMYKLADEDVESNKVFDLPEQQVIVLTEFNISKGDVVFAVYPDTTSFYQAVVVQAPRKGFVMVNFMDDSDENGVTISKSISIQHIIQPP